MRVTKRTMRWFALPIAEQLAIIIYYCLVIGTVQAILAPRKRDKQTVEASNNE